MTDPKETTPKAVLWRENEFGDPDQALYMGRLYVGGIMFLRHAGEWRAWFMDDPEGNEAGRFDSAAEARFCVEGRLLEALPQHISLIVEAGMAS
jgi:hypothetical protein